METKKVIKYHLKKEVKKVLRGIRTAVVVVVAVVAMIPMMNVNAEREQEAMDYCMQKNNNYNYCINGLRG